MTIDVARFGKDSTVIFVWSGLRVVEVVEMAVSSIPDIVNKARELQSKYNINNTNTIADEDGVGGGVVDLLGCLGFVNNSAPIKVKGKKDNFANLKSQCYWILAEAINRNTIYVDCDSESERLLTEELEWVRLPKEVDTHRISLLSKEQIKKAIGRSPDYSDALMMRMLWEVDPNRGKYFVY
jgi:hypothetical protein